MKDQQRLKAKAKKLGLSVVLQSGEEWVVYQRVSSWADGSYEKDRGTVDGCASEEEALEAAIAAIEAEERV